MSSGLYQNSEQVERFTASVTASTIAQQYIAPQDFDCLGMLLSLGTAPGATDGVAVNVSVVPTSQVTSVPTGAPNQAVTNPYNLWTAANVPTILGTAKSNIATSATTTVIENFPYALNYPLPGPSGTVGYVTAQRTSTSTSTPVTAPPSLYLYQLGAFVVPDNTYTDLNNVTSTPASIVHAGDVLSFVITAAGSNVSVGAAANLEILLLLQKR